MVCPLVVQYSTKIAIRRPHLNTENTMTAFGVSNPTSTAGAAPKIDYNVPQPGNDGISSLSWSPTSNYLISTNWDGGVRCWNVQESGGNVQATPMAQGEFPYL